MLPNAQPKGKPHMAVSDEQKRDWQAIDKAESAKVKQRSKGRCEVVHEATGLRCGNRASEVHHHIGGWKRRGRGESALAERKSHVCGLHHREITGHVLYLIAGNLYRRVTR